MKKLLLMYVTCKNVVEAKIIAREAIAKKLIASANIIPQIYSLFNWSSSPSEMEDENWNNWETWEQRDSAAKLRLEKEAQEKLYEIEEALLLMKCPAENRDAVERLVSEFHSYHIPCIVSIDTEKTNQGFLDWVYRINQVSENMS